MSSAWYTMKSHLSHFNFLWNDFLRWIACCSALGISSSDYFMYLPLLEMHLWQNQQILLMVVLCMDCYGLSPLKTIYKVDFTFNDIKVKNMWKISSIQKLVDLLCKTCVISLSTFLPCSSSSSFSFSFLLSCYALVSKHVRMRGRCMMSLTSFVSLSNQFITWRIIL